MPGKIKKPQTHIYGALETAVDDLHQQKGIDAGYTSIELKGTVINEDNRAILTTDIEASIAKLRQEANQFDKVKADAEWQKCFTNFSLQLERQNESDLDNYLVQVRKTILARESFVSGNLRVYPQLDNRNITLDKANVFGRGIDSARAAIQIISYYNYANEDHYRGDKEVAKVKELLKQYQIEINQCSNDLEGLKKAKKAYVNFSGQLNRILVNANICASEKQAFSSVNFMRDYLWINTFKSEITCIEVRTKDSDVTLYQVVTPMTFANDAKSPWENRQNAAWYQQLKKKTGGEWLDNFAHINQANLERLSPSASPIMRTIPNPANATYNLEIIVDGNGKVMSCFRSIGTAIIEPFSIKDDKERQDITTQNLQALMFGQDYQYLTEAAQEYFQRWSVLDSKANSVTIPLLYQTVVVNETNFGVLPDQKKSRTMLENKAHASEQLRRELAGKEIYWDRKENKLLLQKPESFELGRYCSVNFEILDTNYCINRVEKLSKIRDEDVKGAERLINLARMKFDGVHKSGLISDNDALAKLNIIRDFLHDKETPLSNAKERDAELDIALTELTKYLRQYQGDKISQSTAYDLALLMQAAVELKYSASGLKTSSGSLFGVANEFLESDRQRQMVHVAANQAIVADLLGVRTSGCMSNIDRGGELKLQIAARRRQFNIEGRILSAHATESETNAFLNAYAGTRPKHILAGVASGIEATSDAETKGFSSKGTRGLFISTETDDEQKISAMMTSLRKGKTKKPKVKSKVDANVLAREINQGGDEHYAAISLDEHELDQKNQIRIRLKPLLTGKGTAYQSKAIEKIINEIYLLREKFPDQKEDLDAAIDLLYAVKLFRGHSKPNPIWQLLRRVAKRDYEVLAELEVLQDHIRAAEARYAQSQDPNLLLAIEFAQRSLQNRFQNLERHNDRIIDLLSADRFSDLRNFVGQALPEEHEFETFIPVPKTIEQKLTDVIAIDLNEFEVLSKEMSPGQFGTLQQFRYNGNNPEILAVCDDQRRLMIKQAKKPQEPIKPTDFDTNPKAKEGYENDYKAYEIAIAKFPKALRGLIAEGRAADKLRKAYDPKQGAHLYNLAYLAKLGETPIILSRFEALSEKITLENGQEKREGVGESMAGFFTSLGSLSASHDTPFLANGSHYIAQSVDGVANSLEAMRNAKIYHGDLAPRNFMMQTEFSGDRLARVVPVAIDNGFARALTSPTGLSIERSAKGVRPIRWLSKHALESQNVSGYDEAYAAKLITLNVLSSYLELTNAEGQLDETACMYFPQPYDDLVRQWYEKNDPKTLETFRNSPLGWFYICRKFYTTEQALEMFMQNMEAKVSQCQDPIKKRNALDIIYAYSYYNTQYTDIDYSNRSEMQIQEDIKNAITRDNLLLSQANQNYIIISLERIAQQIRENPPQTDAEKQAILDSVKSVMCLKVSDSVKKSLAYEKMMSHLDNYEDVANLIEPLTEQIRIFNFNSFIREFARLQYAETIDVNQWRRLLQTQLSPQMTNDVDFKALNALVYQSIDENNNTAVNERNAAITSVIARLSTKMKDNGEIHQNLIQGGTEIHQVSLAIQLQSPASDFILVRKPVTIQDAPLSSLLFAEELQHEAALSSVEQAPAIPSESAKRDEIGSNMSGQVPDIIPTDTVYVDMNESIKKAKLVSENSGENRTAVDHTLKTILDDLKERIADEKNYLRTLETKIRLIEIKTTNDAEIIKQRKYFGFAFSNQQKELLANMPAKQFGFAKQLKDINNRMVSASLVLDELADELANINTNTAEKSPLVTEITRLREQLRGADDRLDVCDDRIKKSKNWMYQQNIKNSQLKMMERAIDDMYEDHALTNKYIKEKVTDEVNLTRQIQTLNEKLQLCAEYLAKLPKDDVDKLRDDFNISEKQANRIVEIRDSLLKYERAFANQRSLLQVQQHQSILDAAEGHAVNMSVTQPTEPQPTKPRKRAFETSADVESRAAVDLNRKRQESNVAHEMQHTSMKNMSHETLTEKEFSALMKIKSIYPVKNTHLSYRQEGINFSYERQENIPKRLEEDIALDAMCTHYLQVAKAINDYTVDVSGDKKLVNSVCMRLAALGLKPKTISGEYQPSKFDQVAIAEKRLEYMKAGIITEADIPKDDAYSNTLTEAISRLRFH